MMDRITPEAVDARDRHQSRAAEQATFVNQERHDLGLVRSDDEIVDFVDLATIGEAHQPLADHCRASSHHGYLGMK
jgi:hypothetical protein